MSKIYKRGNRYGIDFTDHKGRRVRHVVASDRTVAQMMLADAVKASERLRAGVVLADPREARKAFQMHVDAYISELRRRGRDTMYAYVVRKHLEAAAKDQAWTCLRDCTVQSVTARLQNLQGLSPKTINAHRADLAAFFGWARRSGRMESCPTDHIPKSAVKVERTRRALSVAECRALLRVAPRDRRVAYLTLLYTGLRRAEAGALRWGHLHLNSVSPFVELPATLTKSGKNESVPLVAELAQALRDHRGDADDGDMIFARIPSMDEFRQDLAAAHIDEIDGRGRRVVVHSLRHTLCTLMATNNIPLAVAQRVMRHRDPKLTAVHYLDEGHLPLASALASLPSLSSPTIPPAAPETREA